MKTMFFKNARVYRLTNAIFQLITTLSDDLENFRFDGAQKLATQTVGWVPPYEGDDSLVRFVGDVALLTLRTSNKLMPAGVVAEIVKTRAKEFEATRGYKPGHKLMREIKERTVDELLPKAFDVYRDTRVLFLLDRGLMLIDSASHTRADEVIGMLAKCADPFPLENLYVVQSPKSAMTDWLAEDEAPANFTIDQDTELRAGGESRAAIRYVKHSIDAADVRRHIQSGKQATRLAMTWADRISFVLTEGLDFKRIEPLDVIKEGDGEIHQDEHERRDAELTLFAGEFGKLVAEMIHALGGEKELS